MDDGTPEHKRVRDFAMVVDKMSQRDFSARYGHPFLFGREVLEEEFRFQTLVTSGESMERSNLTNTDVFRIRHWIIPVKKPAGAAAKDRIFMGRATTNDICVPHRTVSKLHAYFVRDPDITTRWFVVDAGSANGTKTNGARLEPRARADLVDGDTVAFGRCVFQWVTAASLYDRVRSLTSGQRRPDSHDIEDAP